MSAERIQPHVIDRMEGTGDGATAESERSRSRLARFYSGILGAAGTVAGITPHVLHHVGPLAGAALLTGTGGSVLFGAVGFVATTPLLWRLKRRFGSWLAPGIALTIFAAMFTISTLWIGPAIRDAIGSDDGTQAPLPDPHHSAAQPGVAVNLVLAERTDSPWRHAA